MILFRSAISLGACSYLLYHQGLFKERVIDEAYDRFHPCLSCLVNRQALSLSGAQGPPDTFLLSFQLFPAGVLVGGGF